MILELLTLTQTVNPKIETTPPLQPPAIVETVKQKTYTVKKGDSLTKIAKKTKVPVKRIWAANKKIKHQDVLDVGMKIKLPTKDARIRPRAFVESYTRNISTFEKKPIVGSSKYVRRGSAPAGYYPSGQCTNLVWSMRSVPAWGDATSWWSNAQRDGYITSSVPRAGAIAWRVGHVAYVIRVKGSRVQIKEANYDYRGSVRTIWVATSSYKYIY